MDVVIFLVSLVVASQVVAEGGVTCMDGSYHPYNVIEKPGGPFYRINAYPEAAFEDCVIACCRNEKCYAYVYFDNGTTSNCTIYRRFPESQILCQANGFYRLGYPSRRTNGPFVIRRKVIGSDDRCAENLQVDYKSFALGECTLFDVSEDGKRTATQVFTLDAHNKTVFYQAIWYNAPGCSVSGSHRGKPDMNITHINGSCLPESNHCSSLSDRPSGPVQTAVSSSEPNNLLRLGKSSPTMGPSTATSSSSQPTPTASTNTSSTLGSSSQPTPTASSQPTPSFSAKASSTLGSSSQPTPTASSQPTTTASSQPTTTASAKTSSTLGSSSQPTTTASAKTSSTLGSSSQPTPTASSQPTPSSSAKASSTPGSSSQPTPTASSQLAPSSSTKASSPTGSSTQLAPSSSAKASSPTGSSTKGTTTSKPLTKGSTVPISTTETSKSNIPPTSSPTTKAPANHLEVIIVAVAIGAPILACVCLVVVSCAAICCFCRQKKKSKRLTTSSLAPGYTLLKNMAPNDDSESDVED